MTKNFLQKSKRFFRVGNAVFLIPMLHVALFLFFSVGAKAQALHTFGMGANGRLGTGSISSQFSPLQVGWVVGWQKISLGSSHSLAIKADGTLWAWGSGADGRLGTGNTTDQLNPVQIGTGTNWQKVSAGVTHSLAIKTDGTLWAWGYGSDGQLGTGNTTTQQLIPVQIGAATNWLHVSAGGGHSLAIKTDGTLWAWGLGWYGALGIGNTTQQNSPVQVGTATNWQQITAGGNYSLAIKTNGTLWSWGFGGHGRLGTGNTTQQTSPVQIGVATNWQQVSAGESHCLAVKTDGTLWSWGNGANGRLGTGNTSNQLSPVQIGSATNWQQVGAGESHSLAVKTDGTLWSWGNGANGRLGTGNITQQNSPVQVGTATNWLSISVGQHHSSALSQPPACPTGNIVLNTQTEVSDFAAIYSNCTAIPGDMTITTVGANVTDLSPLNNIVSIGGELKIYNNPGLINIGFGSLTSVGDGVYVENNPALNNLDSFSSLTTVGSHLHIRENASLTTMSGLSNIASVGGYLYFYDNDALTDLNGLSSLATVGAYVYIEGNDALSDISALQNTTFQPSSSLGLTIKNNPVLGVCNIPNFCSYLANPASTHPRDISGNLTNCLNEVAVVAACASPCPPGNVFLHTQAQVDSFIARYPNCTQISGNLFVGVTSGISNITNLSPLNNIDTVTGNLNIERTALTSTNGLNKLSSVQGYVYIGLNTSLTQISNLDSFVSIGMSLNIRDNSSLTDMNGLSNLSTIGSFLQILGNPALANVNGLSSLASVGAFLFVYNNDALTDLNGLSSLTTVGQDIDIQENNVLANISALQNTTFQPTGTFGLTIVNNPALAACSMPNFCSYLKNPAATHPRNISGNLSNCLDEAAVIAACILSVEDLDKTDVNVYPNPVQEMLYFSEAVSNVRVADMLGRMVQQQAAKGMSVNLSGLPNGVYILSATTDNGKTLMKKIVKE